VPEVYDEIPCGIGDGEGFGRGCSIGVGSGLEVSNGLTRPSVAWEARPINRPARPNPFVTCHIF